MTISTKPCPEIFAVAARTLEFGAPFIVLRKSKRRKVRNDGCYTIEAARFFENGCGDQRRLAVESLCAGLGSCARGAGIEQTGCVECVCAYRQRRLGHGNLEPFRDGAGNLHVAADADRGRTGSGLEQDSGGILACGGSL